MEQQNVTVAHRPAAWYSDPAALVTAVIGAVMASLGATAVLRAGLEPPLTEQVVLVAGFLHTALLGVVEVLAGALLVAAAMSRSRHGAMAVGGGIAALATIAALRADTLGRPFALEERYGWLVVMMSLVVVSANLYASPDRSSPD